MFTQTTSLQEMFAENQKMVVMGQTGREPCSCTF